MKAHELLQESAYTLTQRGEQNGYDKKEERSAAEIAALFRTGLPVDRDAYARLVVEWAAAVEAERLPAAA